jgi:mRNA interferase HicA
VKYNELIRILQKDGWFVIRQTGSHLIMKHSSKSGQVNCPNHGSKEIGKGLAIKILKEAGLF